MSIRLEDFIAKLPKEEREAIEKRGNELILEEKQRRAIHDSPTSRNDESITEGSR